MQKRLEKKTQSTLESTLAFAAGMALLGAAMGIWGWGNAHIPIRQLSYEATRVAAGTPSRQVSEQGASPSAMQPLWPTYKASPAI